MIPYDAMNSHGNTSSSFSLVLSGSLSLRDVTIESKQPKPTWKLKCEMLSKQRECLDFDETVFTNAMNRSFESPKPCILLPLLFMGSKQIVNINPAPQSFEMHLEEHVCEQEADET